MPVTVPITELVFGPAPIAFRANPHDLSLIKPAYDIIKSADGLIKEYYGLKIEDKATTYCFFVWESMEAHMNFMNDKQNYLPMINSVTSMIDTAALTMWHIRTSSETFPALEAPVTELTTFTLHDGQSRPELEALVNEITQTLNGAPDSAGIVHATSGSILEADNIVSLIVGWASLEAHRAAVESEERIVAMFTRAQAIAEIDVMHTSQTLYVSK